MSWLGLGGGSSGEPWTDDPEQVSPLMPGNTPPSSTSPKEPPAAGTADISKSEFSEARGDGNYSGGGGGGDIKGAGEDGQSMPLASNRPQYAGPIHLSTIRTASWMAAMQQNTQPGPVQKAMERYINFDPSSTPQEEQQFWKLMEELGVDYFKPYLDAPKKYPINIAFIPRSQIPMTRGGEEGIPPWGLTYYPSTKTNPNFNEYTIYFDKDQLTENPISKPKYVGDGGLFTTRSMQFYTPWMIIGHEFGHIFAHIMIPGYLQRSYKDKESDAENYLDPVRKQHKIPTLYNGPFEEK